MTALEATIMEQIPVVSLEIRRDTLAARLDTGFDKIEEATRQGKDTTRWEDAWTRLLSEYEGICDQINDRPGANIG